MSPSPLAARLPTVKVASILPFGRIQNYVIGPIIVLICKARVARQRREENQQDSHEPNSSTLGGRHLAGDAPSVSSRHASHCWPMAKMKPNMQI